MARRGVACVAAYFAATLVTGALLAPLAYWLIAPVTSTGIVRVTSRCLLLMAILLAPIALRCCAVDARVALGMDGPRVLRRGLLLGVALGIASFLPPALLLLGLGARAISGSAADTGLTILAVLPAALGAGFVVAVVEETLFRGVVFSAARPAGPAAAIALSAVLYALVHFLRPASGASPIDPVHWYSGFTVIGTGLARFADPAPLAGDFLALLAAGVALGLVREHSGHLTMSIGLHAAWVMGIKLTRAIAERAPDSPWAWLVGEFDGVIGYLAAGWIVVVTCLLATSRRRSPPRQARPGS